MIYSLPVHTCLDDRGPLFQRSTNPNPKPNAINPNPISNHNLQSSGPLEKLASTAEVRHAHIHTQF